MGSAFLSIPTGLAFDSVGNLYIGSERAIRIVPYIDLTPTVSPISAPTQSPTLTPQPQYSTRPTPKPSYLLYSNNGKTLMSGYLTNQCPGVVIGPSADARAVLWKEAVINGKENVIL